MPNWERIGADLRKVIKENGMTAAVTLREGAAFTVPVGKGRSRTTDLTQGLEQERDRVIVQYDEWHGVAPRAPEKGDLMVVVGKRYRISDVKQAEAGDQILAYRFFLES
jgi:hypothetical protein